MWASTALTAIQSEAFYSISMCVQAIYACEILGFHDGDYKGYCHVGCDTCGRLPAEILGSNPTGGMDICLL